MKRGKFDITVLTLGFAFLYIPIIILIVYSFNASSWSPSGVAFRCNGIAPCGRTRG